jgi:hypothetical protein
LYNATATCFTLDFSWSRHKLTYNTHLSLVKCEYTQIPHVSPKGNKKIWCVPFGTQRVEAEGTSNNEQRHWNKSKGQTTPIQVLTRPTRAQLTWSDKNQSLHCPTALAGAWRNELWRANLRVLWECHAPPQQAQALSRMIWCVLELPRQLWS